MSSEKLRVMKYQIWRRKTHVLKRSGLIWLFAMTLKKKFRQAGIIDKYRKYVRLSAVEKYRSFKRWQGLKSVWNGPWKVLELPEEAFTNDIKTASNTAMRAWELQKNKPYAVEQHSLKTKRSYGRDRFGTHQIICKETSRQNYRWARYFHFWIQCSCILKQRDLMPTPDHFLLSAANELKDKTEFAHHMWQTDFTYLKIMGWGWY